MSSASVARATRQIQRKIAAQLAGKSRGPDHAPDRRVPHRDSYDVNDAKAKPWRRIGDGSVGAGLAHRDALLQTAEELYHELWGKHRGPEVRDARRHRDALAAELQEHMITGNAPIGRPAVIRRELTRLEAMLDRARHRLRRIDLTVLKALIKRVDFQTGKLFPAIERIAADAGCHRNSVLIALRRLKGHGLIAWVRRTIRTDNAGAFAPQREQTSNAYYFDHRQKMAPRTWQRFVQLLTIKLRRLGSVPAAIAEAVSAAVAPAEPADPELRATLARVSALLPHAST